MIMNACIYNYRVTLYGSGIESDTLTLPSTVPLEMKPAYAPPRQNLFVKMTSGSDKQAHSEKTKSNAWAQQKRIGLIVSHWHHPPMTLHDEGKLLHFLRLRFRQIEFTQCLSSVGLENRSPLNTWPRCEPHRAQTISVRRPSASGNSLIAPGSPCQNAGQPHPLSNFVDESYNGAPHPLHTYVPAATSLSYFPTNGRSVDFSRNTAYSSLLNFLRQSESDWGTGSRPSVLIVDSVVALMLESDEGEVE